MNVKEAIDTIKKECIEINVYITDAWENPYCNIIGKVLCGNKRDEFERDVHRITKKYQGITSPSEEESTDMLNDMVDLCQKYDDRNRYPSDKFIIPSSYLNITMAEDGTIEDMGINTTKSNFKIKFDG